MTLTEHLKAEIEATAAHLNIAPSTVGERAGQGGQFYRRLCEGKRVWPETAESVLARLDAMKSSHDSPPLAGRDISHGKRQPQSQGGARS